MANTRKSNSTDLTVRVAAQIAPLLPAHSSILVGLSGGVDSVVLLHLLHKLAPRFSWQLSALHVHHGISPNADVWADFCADLCEHYLIPLHIERVDIAPLRAHGIEAAARKLRHVAFLEQCCDFVAVAHHADDQAETLLLQLLRGAGVRGASAMPVLSTSKRPVLSESKPVEGDESINFLRPLLHSTRQEILDYAAVHHLHWIEDESNADDSYPRNFLRHRVMPLLGERFPACRDTLARSAQHFAEASELLDDLARLDAPDLFPSPAVIEQGSSRLPPLPLAGEGDARMEVHSGALEISRLQSLSRPRAKNLLRYFLHRLGAPMPQAVQLDDMLQQLCHARQDAAVCIEYGDWQVHRYQGGVYVLRAPGDFDRNLVLAWQGEPELDWPALNIRLRFEHEQAAGISLAKLRRAPVTLRLRQGGEALRPHPNAATRTLKNLLQEHPVPPWWRDRLPLLYCGEELVCVPGVAIAAEYQAGAAEEGVRLSEVGECG
ncbi:MAG: tRNA lysidine(34) synthetase TilS [Gallionella sp.]|nr:tRNA lysidine(34) synthetase TilS [Gallionella sp.]